MIIECYESGKGKGYKEYWAKMLPGGSEIFDDIGLEKPCLVSKVGKLPVLSEEIVSELVGMDCFENVLLVRGVGMGMERVKRDRLSEEIRMRWKRREVKVE